MHTDYTGQGVDQLADVIDTIKNNPTSRRIMLCSWNPRGKFLSVLLESCEGCECAQIWFGRFVSRDSGNQSARSQSQ